MKQSRARRGFRLLISCTGRYSRADMRMKKVPVERISFGRFLEVRKYLLSSVGRGGRWFRHGDAAAEEAWNRRHQLQFWALAP